MKELIEIQSELKAEQRKIPDKSGIYIITNPIGQSYVGGTKNLFKRFRQYSCRSFKGQRKLNESFKIFGKDNHVFGVLELCKISELNTKERHWSIKYNVIDGGLNLAITGDDSNKCIIADETKKMIGEKHKGKIIPEYQRKIISERLKGKKQTAEHIEKRKMVGDKNPAYKNKWNLGRKMTDEQVKAISERMKGKGLLGDNNNAKKVIDVTTGKIYDSAKEVSMLYGINYSTLKAWLNGKNVGGKHSNQFKYI